MKIKYAVFYCVLLSFLCSCESKEFTKELWMREVDGSYTDREFIINDFLSTYQDSIVNYEDLTGYLGDPINRHKERDNLLYYLIVTKPKYSVDPDVYRYLVVELGKDSTVKDMRIVDE